MAGLPDSNLAPGAKRRFHQLPLISVLLSLVFPVFILVELGWRFVWQVNLEMYPADAALSVAGTLGALVTGHLAVFHARRDPPAQAGRGLAITALVLSYLSLAFMVLVVWLLLSLGHE